VLSLVDRLVLLAEGKSLYCGPSSGLVPYFATSGFLCPESTSPYDFIIDLVAVDYGSRTGTSLCRARITQLAARWALHRRLDTPHRHGRHNSLGNNKAPVGGSGVGGIVVYDALADDVECTPTEVMRTSPQHSSPFHLLLLIRITMHDIWSDTRCQQLRIMVIKWSPYAWLRSLYLLLCRNCKEKLRNWKPVVVELAVVMVLSCLVVVVVAVSLVTKRVGYRNGSGVSSGFFREVEMKAVGMFLIVFIQVS
jgi:hypothetical protein